MYAGPRRSSTEEASIETTMRTEELGDDTTLSKVDGVGVSGSGTYVILPGRHSVEVIGTKRPPASGPMSNLIATFNKRKKTLVACFMARGGHSYVVRTWGALAKDGLWTVEIFDQDTTDDAKTECKERQRAIGPIEVDEWWIVGTSAIFLHLRKTPITDLL
jgi:hypothetical protein